MYLIFAVELRGPFTKKDSKRWDKLNPDRGDRPGYFYVAIRTKAVPTMEAPLPAELRPVFTGETLGTRPSAGQH